MPVWRRRLPARREAPREARQFVIESLAPHLYGQTMRDAALGASELVTNAVKHSTASPEDPIDLTILLESDLLRITVKDRGEGFDPAVALSKGRIGLALVDDVATDWGVSCAETGTDVWFQMQPLEPS